MEELRKQNEQKYNLNLDISNKNGENTYWDLREYFVKELESDGIIMVNTDYVRTCCHTVDIGAIREEFETKFREIVPDFNEVEDCEDEWRVGCRRSEDTNEQINNNESNENYQNPPPYEN
tara:strand:- start:109 stop:468 length:360 start_codon:yes stop_codon:yes gene_type:complete